MDDQGWVPISTIADFKRVCPNHILPPKSTVLYICMFSAGEFRAIISPFSLVFNDLNYLVLGQEDEHRHTFYP